MSKAAKITLWVVIAFLFIVFIYLVSSSLET
jgi:hypothetical protein